MMTFKLDEWVLQHYGEEYKAFASELVKDLLRGRIYISHESCRPGIQPDQVIRLLPSHDLMGKVASFVVQDAPEELFNE